MFRLGPLLLLLLAAIPAYADQAPFLGADPTVVSGQGVMTVQQWFSWAHGNNNQSFNAFESQTEFDLGLTDRLDLALTLVYDWSRERASGGPAVTDSEPGFAAELLYLAMPVETSPFGLAFAIDPTIDGSSRAFAFRVLLEKRASGLQHVLNINFDNEWQKDGLGHWQGTSGIAFNYGLAYAVDEHWTVALEFGNELAFDDLLIGGRLTAHTNTIYIGPTVQYDCALAAISFGVQTQLPIASGSGVAHSYTDDAERLRLSLRLARTI